MRIAYFAHVNGGSESGVHHKIEAQLRAWRSAGHSTLACVATRDDPDHWRTRMGSAIVRRYTGYRSRLLAMARLVQGVRRYSPDVVYMRWDLFYPPMLALPNSAALVIEVNTDDVEEYRLGSPLRAYYNARTRRLLMSRARGMVFVTSELCAAPPFRGLRAVRRVVANGVELGSYPQLLPRATGAPRLVFVGTAGQPWHGIDKVLTLARLQPDWQVDIVGSHGLDSEPSSNVTWHGPLSRSRLLPILERADVGIGTLALHRKGMDEACSLKLREYLAVGLPVVYGHQDRDVDGVVRESLRIPNTETNVVDDLERISRFVHACRGKRVPRSTVQHIDVTRKEEQRLGLFDTLAGR